MVNVGKMQCDTPNCASVIEVAPQPAHVAYMAHQYIDAQDAGRQMSNAVCKLAASKGWRVGPHKQPHDTCPDCVNAEALRDYHRKDEAK